MTAFRRWPRMRGTGARPLKLDSGSALPSRTYPEPPNRPHFGTHALYTLAGPFISALQPRSRYPTSSVLVACAPMSHDPRRLTMRMQRTPESVTQIASPVCPALSGAADARR